MQHGLLPSLKSRHGLQLLVAATLVLVAPSARGQVALTVLHAFAGGRDGAVPLAPLLADTSGPGGSLRALYGTTLGGGNTGCFNSGCGTAFRLLPPKAHKQVWKENILWTFTDSVDGAQPYRGLATQSGRITGKTALYGSTTAGGSGFGTVFSLIGKKVTTIWTFTGGSDGSTPLNTILNAGGNLSSTPFPAGERAGVERLCS